MDGVEQSRVTQPNKLREKMKMDRTSTESKRLLFDRRYGWVIDEWKDPSEEALAGGRGMFCILPLAKTLVTSVTQMVNVAATSAVKALEKPELLSPQELQAGLHERVEKLMLSIQNSVFHCGLQKSNSPSLPFSSLDQPNERMDECKGSSST